MSLPIPLCVRLATSRRDVVVTREVRDLTFDSAIPGGFGTCTLTIDRSLKVDAEEIAAFGKVYVTDTRHGGIVWEGRLEDPGRGVDSDGEVWTVTAVGGAANTHDRSLPLIYVDRSLERITRGASSRKSMETDIDGETVRIMARRGDGVGSTSFAEMILPQFGETGQEIARVEFGWDAGITDADWRVQVIASPSETLLLNAAASTAGGAVTAYTPPAGTTSLKLRMQRQTSALTVANDSTWVAFTNLATTAQRYNANGTLKTSGYLPTLTASDVVADVLGRLLAQCDGTNASIAATTYAIDHLAFYDPIDAAGVLDEVLKYHLDHTYAVWETNASGKYKGEFYKLPTGAARFEATARDGFAGPGSAADLFDKVTVRWRSKTGQIKSTVRTQSVPALTAAGITRQAMIDLSDFSGSQANANQAGDVFLAQHRYAANAGTLQVNRPIYDAKYGRMLMPWELVRHAPGQLIRVRDIAPRPDSLNLTDRDGATVFRAVGVTYSPDGGASLALDSQPRLFTQLIAQTRRELRRASRR